MLEAKASTTTMYIVTLAHMVNLTFEMQTK